MSPEYGATIAICPIDEMTLDYLRLTGRDPGRVALVEAYAKEQGLFRTPSSVEPIYTQTVELDLSTVEPSIAGPKRPQDRVPLNQAKLRFAQALEVMLAERKAKPAAKEKPGEATRPHETAAVAATAVADHVPGMEGLDHGSVVVAAITSCTNTSNPSVMIGAGLLARNATRRGLKTKPWVKPSLAPGSLVVTEYLRAAGLPSRSRSSGSTWSATAARHASATAAAARARVVARPREEPRRRVGAVGQHRNWGRIQSQVRATIWRRRRSSSRTRSPERCSAISPPNRSGTAATGSLCSCATSGRASARSRRRC
jgi:aconitate hydratase